jgi:hypothetical protein
MPHPAIPAPLTMFADYADETMRQILAFDDVGEALVMGEGSALVRATDIGGFTDVHWWVATSGEQIGPETRKPMIPTEDLEGTDADRRARAEEHLRLLRTVAMVPDKLPDLVAILGQCSADEDVDDCLGEVADLFDCDEVGARAVLDSQIRRLHPNERKKLADVINDMTTQLNGGTI